MTINIYKEFEKQFITSREIGNKIFEIIKKEFLKSDVPLMNVKLNFENIINFTSVPFNTMFGKISSLNQKDKKIRIEVVNSNSIIAKSFEYAKDD